MVEPSDTISSDAMRRWDNLSKEELSRQLVYEKSIAGCARSLLCGQQSKDALSSALGHLGLVNPHYYGFIARPSDDNGKTCRFSVMAATRGGDPEKSCKPLLIHFEGSPRLREKMAPGEVLSGRVEDPGCMDPDGSEDGRDAPVLCAPIHALGDWWGLLGLVSDRSDHGWEGEDHRLLLTAAEFFSVHFERQEALVEHEEKNRLAGALEMAGVVCHKLNQPTQVILGYSSMITSGDIQAQDQIVDVVKMIEDETRKMGIITKNLMGITRMREAIFSDIDSPDLNPSDSEAGIRSTG